MSSVSTTTRSTSRKGLFFVPLLLFGLILVLISLLATQFKNEFIFFSPMASSVNSNRRVNHNGEKQSGKNGSNTESVGAGVIESYVISLDADRLDRFYERNNHTGIQSVWVPGTDGFHQPTLNLWSQLVHNGLPPLNASYFVPGLQEHKDRYASPHAVGCYLAHWHVLRTLHHRPEALRPELYMVFEDDTACVPQLAPRLLEITRKLPPDWDMLFISGKPFVYFREDDELFNTTWSNDEVEQKVCAGHFGVGAGITNPNGSRHLRHSDDYWRTTYITNTPSYLVNPRRMDRIMEVLEPMVYEPIDIRLGNAMKRGKLNVFMTPLQLCSTARQDKLDEPTPWNGFWVFVDSKNGGMTYYYRTTDIHAVSSNCSI